MKGWRLRIIGTSLGQRFCPQGNASQLSPFPCSGHQGQSHYLSASMGLCLLKWATKDSIRLGLLRQGRS